MFASISIRGSQFAHRDAGWVEEMGGCIAGCAHDLAKSGCELGHISRLLLALDTVVASGYRLWHHDCGVGSSL